MKNIVNTIAVILSALSLLLNAGACKAEEKDKYDISFYGTIKLDTAYDTARLNIGNFARWVEPQPGGENDDELNITGRQTRFGVMFSNQKQGNYTITGKAEIDFYGGGSENKPEPMLRHGYFQIEWHELDLALLTGQTWDLFSPLNAPTLNYPASCWAGNIGYRRPQIRISKKLRLGDDLKLEIAAAIARTIGHKSGYDPGDSGEDNAFPTFQGRIGLTSKFANNGSFSFGFSGHYGQEEYDVAADGSNVEFASWSMNLDVRIKLSSTVTLQGEYFVGQNLDSYLGGVGQGINLNTMEEIRSSGGWAAVTMKFDSITWNVAAAMDDPDDETLSSGQRSRNTSLWTNVFFPLVDEVVVGLELARWETDYKDGECFDSIRSQLAFIYSF
jgi:hypothetical protein